MRRGIGNLFDFFGDIRLRMVDYLVAVVMAKLWTTYLKIAVTLTDER